MPTAPSRFQPQSPPGSSQAPDDLQRFRALVRLVPVLGVVPALVSLYGGDRALREVSRTAVILAFSWVCATVLLGAGANLPVSHTATLRLLLANGFVGTGYFLTSFWLMWRVWRRQSIRLPGVSRLGKRLP